MATPRFELNERERKLQREMENYLQSQWTAIGDEEKEALGLYQSEARQRVLWTWAIQFMAKKLEPLELALEEVGTLRQFTFSTPTNRIAVDAVADMAEAIVQTPQRGTRVHAESNGVLSGARTADTVKQAS